jgi:predicted dehydrogenase
MERHPFMTKQARIAIVGVGWWTTTAHIPALLNNPDAVITALADTRSDVMEKATQTYNLAARRYTDYKTMLAEAEIDGVIVATNHTTHYEIAKACLEAGKHVMVEKPMVLKARHAYDLRDLAAQKGVELIVGYPWHYTANTLRARELVQSGKLGTIEYVTSLFSSMVIEFLRGNEDKYRSAFNYPVTGPGSVYADPARSGGGQGHLQVTHSAATMFFVTGLRAQRVSAYMNHLDLQVDVCDAIAVRFQPESDGKPGAVGVVGSTGNIGVGDSGVNELQVYGELGRLTLDHVAGTLYVRYHDGAEMHGETLPPDQRYPSGVTSANLVDVILGKAANGSPAEVGVRVVELLDAAYRSAEGDGIPVSIADL